MRQVFKTLTAVALAVSALTGVAEARDAGTLIVVQSSEPVGLDAMRNSLASSLNVGLNVEDRLFEPMENGDVGPALAESWEFKDTTTLVVHLKKGLTFQDGEPVNAEAVKFSYDRLMSDEIKSPHKGRLTQITSVSVIDPLTVEFKTDKPFAPILHLMSYYLPIVSPKAATDMGPDEFNRHPVGAGPYMVESWEKGGDIVLKAFDGYWGEKPAYKKVIFRAIPEESARVAALVTGEVDIVEGLSVTSQKSINKSGKAMLTDSMGVMPYVGLNTYEAPFNDERVRQAMNYAVNRALIKKALFDDRGMLAPGVISPRTFGADLSLKPYPYDPEKAKALLKEAGYPDGFKTTLSYPTYMTQINEQAQAIAADLAKIGVQAQLEPLDRAVMWDKYKNRQHKMYMYWWDDNPEPDRYVYSLFDSNSRDYYYKNAETDRLLDLGRSTLDRKEREKIYQEVDRKLYKEAPWLFLYIIPETYGVSNGVDYQGRRDGFLFVRFAKPRG